MRGAWSSEHTNHTHTRLQGARSRPKTSRLASMNRAPSRRLFLTPERVDMRYNTLLDAFLTADRRRRGYLPFDRVLEIYVLYFHSAAAHLKDADLTEFIERYHTISAEGAAAVDYMQLAAALRKRDSLMSSDDADVAAAWQGSQQGHGAALRPGNIDIDVVNTPRGDDGRYGHSNERVSPITWGGPSQTPTRRPADMSDGLQGYSSGLSPQTPSPSKPAANSSSRRHADYTPPRPMERAYALYATENVIRIDEDASYGDTIQAETIRSLLAALEATDVERSGLIFSAQLMMMCRMHGHPPLAARAYYPNHYQHHRHHHHHHHHHTHTHTHAHTNALTPSIHT